MINYLSVRNVVSLNELSEHLEISVRGVQRLKDTLLDAGFQIDIIRGPHGGYAMQSKRHNLNTEFSIEELKFIKQGLGFLIKSDIASSSPSLMKAIAKLSSGIDAYGMDAINSYQSIRLNVDPIKYQEDIETLETAIQNHRKIEIDYNKNHFEKNHYVFQPYSMVVVNSFWYVNGFDDKGRYLSLKVNRIERVIILESTFLKDESMVESSLSQFGYRINPIKVSCLVHKADYISEYIWGKNQVIEWNSDGSFLLNVEFQNENAAKDFILRHGSLVEVLQPIHLVEWLKLETQKILEFYTA